MCSLIGHYIPVVDWVEERSSCRVFRDCCSGQRRMKMWFYSRPLLPPVYGWSKGLDGPLLERPFQPRLLPTVQHSLSVTQYLSDCPEKPTLYPDFNGPGGLILALTMVTFEVVGK